MFDACLKRITRKQLLPPGGPVGLLVLSQQHLPGDHQRPTWNPCTEGSASSLRRREQSLLLQLDRQKLNRQKLNHQKLNHQRLLPRRRRQPPS